MCSAREKPVSTDPVTAATSTADQLIAALQSVSEQDGAVMMKFATAQEEQAKAAHTTARAAMLKHAASAANVYMLAQREGVDLPPSLLAMLTGTDD